MSLTDVRQENAELSSAFLATPMFGSYFRQGGVVAGNGPTASACYVELSVEGCVGFGTWKIMYGQKSIRSNRSDGYTSMHVRRHGTTPGCTRKVSSPLRCHHRRAILTGTIGWGKKMSYCIGFSIDGATDVTRRYVRNHANHGLDRTKAPEEVLIWITNEIRRMRRESLSKEERRRLIKEDEREEKELRGYVAQAIAVEFANLLPGSPTSPINTGVTVTTEDQKHPAGRQSGSAEWIQARGEGGRGQPGPDQSRDRP